MTDLEPGQTYAPSWTVECVHPRCGWGKTGFLASDLEDDWEEHDRVTHGPKERCSKCGVLFPEDDVEFHVMTCGGGA